MKIEALPSPNFNDRKHPIDMLVLHYTGMETGQAALDRMRDAEAGVSAHYMLWEDGRVVQLVGEDKRAWHAGVSRWQGDEDLNSRSIGIEIVNGGHDWPLAGNVLPPYPDAQIDALIELCAGILERWHIPGSRIVGHSDIAPMRKQDPGEHFPWDRLAGAGIGLWPHSDTAVTANRTENARLEKELDLIGRGLSRGDTGQSVGRMQAMLADIGYDLPQSEKYDEQTAACVQAFQLRWAQDRVSGEADLATLQRISIVEDLYRRALDEA
ncbi:MAG: N-acetylmuramoyl-L-alanine amidase [Hyphomonas sp.]|nr:N-acetylmuramoyl-L-alanine amidase [Hyphomonas sp.]